ncbi:MAG: hypothetical protein QF493_12110 [Rhodospirillales bacterium]|jgi:hypothetical protein|nr:hypothetical protein [Rhodospirillales bacterium]|tara:strand:+ start:3860 stop:4036 length:177 start_codon:yes stop_codon:yes gene_type:complete
MNQNMRTRGSSSEKAVKDIRRVTSKQYSAEEKIRIVLDGPIRVSLFNLLKISIIGVIK